MKQGFQTVKSEILRCLKTGQFLHEARDAIDVKNLLLTGEVSVQQIVDIITKCNGTHHQSSPHHQEKTIEVHVLRRDGWYIKFYFVTPDTVFISVHH